MMMMVTTDDDGDNDDDDGNDDDIDDDDGDDIDGDDDDDGGCDDAILDDVNDKRWYLDSGDNTNHVTTVVSLQIQWRPVIWGFILQFLVGLAVLRWDTGREALDYVAKQITKFLGFTDAGSTFVYGMERG